MPMSIQAVVGMQACARIGATHSVVYGGFSAKSIQERIVDAGAVALITADGQFRGGREIALKPVVDEALGMGGCEGIKTVFVYQRTGSSIAMKAGRDVWWHDATAKQPDTCEPTWVNAEHPLFILYTSGSTGKPKGVQHSTGGYLLQAILTMQWTFDYKPTDVFWCTADVGWVTGHTYIAYGPLAVGATEIVFEGVPTYPDAGRFWKTIQSVEFGKGGILVIKRPWPAMIRTIWNDPQRYKTSYYPEDFHGKYYLAGDGASRDLEGYFRIMGRIDDVLNVSGHRLGTMEIESALVANTKLVAEAAVVGRPDDLTGEAVCAFVVLKGPRPSGDEAQKIAKELRDWVGQEIGAIAKPKDIRFGDNLPKTRSGKIMRRLLRSIAKGEEIKQDVSTLENPAILEQLKQST